MALENRLYVRVVIDLLHDLALGVFPGTVLAAWFIRRAVVASDEGYAALAAAGPWLWLVFFLGLTVSVVTGLLRLKYWKLNVRAGFLESKSQMAAVKHSAFVLILLGSAAWLYAILG